MFYSCKYLNITRMYMICRKEISLLWRKVPCSCGKSRVILLIQHVATYIKVFNAIKHENKSLTQFENKLNLLFFFYVLKLFYTRDFLLTLWRSRFSSKPLFPLCSEIFLYYTLLILFLSIFDYDTARFWWPWIFYEIF